MRDRNYCGSLNMETTLRSIHGTRSTPSFTAKARSTCTRKLTRFQRSVFEKLRLGCPNASHVYVNPETPFPENHWASVACMLTETDSHFSFLFVSFACQCSSSVLLQCLCPKGEVYVALRIMDAGDFFLRINQSSIVKNKLGAKWRRGWIC